MRLAILQILLFLVSGFWITSQAQTTAVMEARVKVVSGAGLTSLQQNTINLNPAETISQNVNAGSFSLVAAPGADVSVQLYESPIVTNESGDVIHFESFDVNQVSSESGEHHVSLNAKVNNSQNLKGYYQGNVTAVIEYL